MIKKFKIGNVITFNGAAWIITDIRLDVYTIVSLSGDDLKRRLTKKDEFFYLAENVLEHTKRTMENNF